MNDMRLEAVLPIGPPGFLLANQNSGNTLPIFELQTGPTDYLKLLSIEAMVGNNNNIGYAFGLGLGVPAVAGLGILSALFQPDESSLTDALPGCQIFTQWTRQPTAPTNYLRRMTANTGGSSGNARGPRKMFWFDFPDGIKINPSSSLVLYSTTTVIAVNTSFSDIAITVDD